MPEQAKFGEMSPDFLLLDELAALGETEVGIDHIEVDQLRPVAAAAACMAKFSASSLLPLP